MTFTDRIFLNNLSNKNKAKLFFCSKVNLCVSRVRDSAIKHKKMLLCSSCADKLISWLSLCRDKTRTVVRDVVGSCLKTLLTASANTAGQTPMCDLIIADLAQCCLPTAMPSLTQVQCERMKHLSTI